MFLLELAMAIDSGNQPPVTIAECVVRVLRAEYRLAQVKEERSEFYKARKAKKKKSS